MKSTVSAQISLALASSLEGATITISRLDARVSASFAASAWAQRAAWTGYARALQLQGAEIDEIDAFSWGCDLPLPSRPRRPSHSDEFGDFAAWAAQLAENAPGAWRDRLPFTPAIDRGVPKLLTALHLCHNLGRRDGGITAWLALPGIIRGLGITEGALPCLVGGAKAFRWRATLTDEILRPVLRALEDTAGLGLERLDGIESDRRRAVGALIAEHRPASLTKLTALSALRPVLLIGTENGTPVDSGQAIQFTSKPTAAKGYRSAPIGTPLYFTVIERLQIVRSPVAGARFQRRSTFLERRVRRLSPGLDRNSSRQGFADRPAMARLHCGR